MKTSEALEAFQSLSQETRLSVFRLLVRAGAKGMAAGDIGVELEVPAPTLSFHLNHLANAGLVVRRREGRSLRYSVSFEQVRALLNFLMEDCCQGNASVCGEPAKEEGCCSADVSRRRK